MGQRPPKKKSARKTCVVAIDGPAGSGKSTTAKEVARQLRMFYLDTGAMYRALTLEVLRRKINPQDGPRVADCAARAAISFLKKGTATRVTLNGEDVTERIRGPEVTRNVSAVSAHASSRRVMVALQRKLAAGMDAVIEGRDIGTVVFPRANVKFFLTAKDQERASRRQKELAALGSAQSTVQILKDLKRRDELDSSRSISPLKKASDAIEVDTTDLTFDEQVELIVRKVQQYKKQGG